MNIAELELKPLSELHDMARELEIPNHMRLRKQDLIMRLAHAQSEPSTNGQSFSSGILDIVSDLSLIHI